MNNVPLDRMRLFFDPFDETDFGDSDILKAFSFAFNILCGYEVPVHLATTS